MRLSTTRLALVAAVGAATAGTANAQQGNDDSNWTFFGNTRLRAEFNDTNMGSDRHRQRLRIRLGATYTVDESLSATVRASTGPSGNPRSGYHDIGQGFNRMEFSLDQLFLAYAPEDWGGVTLVGGKFANPVMRTPLYGELLWDADLMPEGAAVVVPLGEMGPFDSSMFAVGHTAVIEQAADSDAFATMFLWNGSMGTEEDENRLDLGVNFYHYGDLTPGANTALVGTGNATNMGATDFLSNFGVLDIPVVYTMGDYILTGEYIMNLRADDSVGDTGFALGAGIDTEMGRFYVQHQTVEQDALVAATAQDDFQYSTNYSTNILGWKDALTDRVGLHVWVQASELEDSFGAADDTVYRFRVDLDVNF